MLTDLIRKPRIKIKSGAGFTLIEIIIVIAILVVLSVVILNVFRTFDESKALSQEASNVISVLEKARQLTLFSKDFSQYGVHFDTDEITLFRGITYSSSDPNNSSTKLHSKVSIASVTLSGGGSDVIFKRLSGETDQDGTIVLQNKFDATDTINITIEKTGLINSKSY